MSEHLIRNSKTAEESKRFFVFEFLVKGNRWNMWIDSVEWLAFIMYIVN